MKQVSHFSLASLKLDSYLETLEEAKQDDYCLHTLDNHMMIHMFNDENPGMLILAKYSGQVNPKGKPHGLG
jgi:hypothetical protein